MSKYAIIQISTGKLDGGINMFDDMSMPINVNELQYVELTERMIESMTNHNEVIDTDQTIFSNGSWTEVFKTPEKINYLANRTRDKNNFLLEAQRRISIEDITDSYREKLQKYIDDLNKIVPTNNEIQQINWPEKPF